MHHVIFKKEINFLEDIKLEKAMFGMGCFWGAERKFWSEDGIFTTAVGYSGGYTENPSYQEVCSGLTGHSEVVRIIYDPRIVSLEKILSIFWDSHDPTQGMRQGNDLGTQYRSSVYCTNQSQLDIVLNSKETYQNLLSKSGYGKITTEVSTNMEFFYAEDYHQQYLAKNPNGYCGLGGTGIKYPF